MEKKIKIIVIRQEENGASVFFKELERSSVMDSNKDFDESLIYDQFEKHFDMIFNRTFCDWFEVNGEISIHL